MKIDIMSRAIYRRRRSCAIGIKGLLEVAEEAREAGFYAGHRELGFGRDNGNHENKGEGWCFVLLESGNGEQLIWRTMCRVVSSDKREGPVPSPVGSGLGGVRGRLAQVLRAILRRTGSLSGVINGRRNASSLTPEAKDFRFSIRNYTIWTAGLCFYFIKWRRRGQF